MREPVAQKQRRISVRLMRTMVTRARKYLPAGLSLLVMMAPGCNEHQASREGPADTVALRSSADSYDVTALLGERTAKDNHFRQDGSPIPEEQRATFPGLQYFAPDTTLVFNLAIAKSANPEPIVIAATKGDQRKMSRYGTFSFMIDGKACTLTAFTSEGNPGALFVPFKDMTNASETYEVGRYLDLALRDDDQYQLDFNLSYNPYCAYNPGYTCPLVPEENILAVAVRAGEKLPPNHLSH